jgi:hypothetical protein
VEPKTVIQQLPRLWATVRTSSIVLAGIILLGLSLAPRTAHAQASAGINGTVTDTSGAVIPDAAVDITNESTGVTVHTTSNSAGSYSYKGLLPSVYDLSVTAAGFKKNLHKGVTVEVSTNTTVDVALTAGAATETVQVTASQIALNTTQPELGSTIEPIVVQALPTVVSGRGRQVDSLQFLAPGTTGSTFSHRVSGGVDFSQEILYNGIPAPQPETEGYSTNFNPPFDLIQEYRVERTTFSAQYGLGQGALTYQTKSGTNQYHGELFEINRNSMFDSVGFFNGPAWGGSTKPATNHENNYGFAVGGPIAIPHVYDGHNRTFGFYTQEWFKQNNMDTDVSTVPSAQQKTGDFTDYVDSDGNLIPIIDPETGTQFECGGVLNVICQDRFSAVSKNLLQYIPDPDRPGSGGGGLDSNKSYTPFVNPKIQHVWGFTVDHNITSKQTIHWAQWRNTFSNWSFDNSPLVVAPNPLNSMKWQPAIGSVFLLSYSNTLTSNLVMTAGAAWVGEINNQYNKTAYSFSAIEGSVIPPNITFSGSHAPTSWGTSGAWLQSTNRKLGIAIVNNWLWTKGKNTFNIGGEYRRSYQDDNEDQTQGGHFQFSQKQTSVQDSSDPNYVNFASWGSPFASFLLGLPNEADRSNSQELRLRNRLIAPYIQDDIKLNSRLTINLGLRWDIQVPFTEQNNLVVFFDPNGTNPLANNRAGAATKLGNCDGCAGYERASIHWGHFGPRLGFAYKLTDKMVLQGGYNVAFLNGGAYEYGTSKTAVSYGNLLVGSYTRNATGSAASSFGNWDSNTMPNPTATAFSTGLGGGNTIHAFSKDDGFAPYSMQWNLNLQRELPWNTFITAAWVGTHVIHLPSQLNPINQLDPTYLSMGNQLADVFTGTSAVDGVASPYDNFVSDFGKSATVAQALTPYPQYANIFNNFEGKGTTYYQSIQVEAEKRFTNGLSFMMGYTLSHLMDNTNSAFGTFTAGAINKYNQKPEWTVSDNDEPQTLKASGTYELPIGPKKKFLNNRTIGNIAGGWQVGWVLDYEAGSAFGVSEDETTYPNAGNRPDRNTGSSLSSASYKHARDYFLGKSTSSQIFTPGAFTETANYVIGNSKRIYSELRNPAYLMENLNVQKHFQFSERYKGTLQMDYFNAFNRTRFQGPVTNASASGFGSVTSQGSQIDNRQGQVSFHLEF